MRPQQPKLIPFPSKLAVRHARHGWWKPPQPGRSAKGGPKARPSKSFFCHLCGDGDGLVWVSWECRMPRCEPKWLKEWRKGAELGQSEPAVHVHSAWECGACRQRRFAF